MSKIDKTAWSDTWRHPTLTSFGAGMPNNYDGPIREFWRRQLDGKFETVVDLACGNGALVWLCNDILNATGPVATITGVDSATIAPFQTLGRNPSEFPGVSFISDTPIEKLPFEDNSVDLVVSQFGVEYSNLSNTIPEVARVLKAEGKMSFMMHDSDSEIVTSAARSIGDYRHLLDHVKAHDVIRDLAVAVSAHGDVRQFENTAAYKDLIGRIEQTTPPFMHVLEKHKSIEPVLVYKSKLNNAFQLIHTGLPEKLDEALATLDDAEKGFRRNIECLADLISVAPSEQARDDLKSLAERLGFVVQANESIDYRPGEMWGRVFVASRQSG